MRKLVVGILAHVDAGKTTLSEALLYQSGALRRLGRVDHQDAFLDTDAMERERGITIFSKQAVFSLADTEVTLLDTPGHVDFSAEAERTLQVLDCAILVISGTDGVQAHTRTLWRLLERYHVPTFLFVNKVDLAGADRSAVLAGLKQHLGSGCVDFSGERDESFREEAAVCDESVLERYLETGVLTDGDLRRMVGKRKLFPCWFGSALKLEGVSEFLEGVEQYAPVPAYPETFGARIYKIARDGHPPHLFKSDRRHPAGEEPFDQPPPRSGRGPGVGGEGGSNPHLLRRQVPYGGGGPGGDGVRRDGSLPQPGGRGLGA